MEKVNFPENTLIYLNQAYLAVKKNQKKFCCDYFILGQIIEVSTPPYDMSACNLKENKVKMVRPRCSSETGEFPSLYDTVCYIVVKG